MIMKFKMRVLHFSPAGNAERIASAIAREQRATSDQIPPAYPIENEKLAFIGMELKGSGPDKAVANLCNDLNTSRVRNVAFFVVGGDASAVNSLQSIITSKGINVVGDTFACTGKGLFKKTISDEDVSAAVAWANKIVDSLAE